MNDPEEVFEYSPTVNEDVMMMVSTYNVTHDQQISDILFMYYFIPLVIWIGIFTAFILFASILHAGQKLLSQGSRKKIDSIWLVFAAFADQDDFSFSLSDPKHSRFVILMSLVISIFLFFFRNFMNNSVSSDLIVIEKAFAPSSYDEILARKIIPGLNPMFAEYQKFEESPKGSNQRKLFERSITFELQPETFIQHHDAILRQELCVVGRRMIIEAAGLGLLTVFGKRYPDLRGLLAQDKQANRYTNVFAINKFVSPQLKSIFQRTYVSFASVFHDFSRTFFIAS